jgi:glycosyltransferase involved in cell wall biosynthesis
MNDHTPLVSACLLTYKRANVLPRTIEDILSQTFGDFELVINDDRSPDNTEEVCRSYAARDPRIRYFRNDTNLRYAGNQNAAVARARGKYVAFLHDGDRYSPRLLQEWTAALEAHPSAGLVFNAVNVLGRDGEIAGGFDHGYSICTPGLQLYDEMLGRLDSPIFGIVMARRQALLDAGPFDTSLPVLADIDMWFRLLRHHDVCYVAERLYSIYPREEDHPNAYVNWRIRDELAHIYRRACSGRFPAGSREWRATRRRVDLDLLRTDCRLLASCLVRRRWKLAAQGVSATASRFFQSLAAQADR